MTKPKNPREHYRREKERRENAPKPESELMAAARREYEALLAAQATKGKGGRPKKTAAKKPATDELEDETQEDSTNE
ncbi:MAG TPA: hypothetical protein VGM82_21915 [Gemmatimonadaceae bacterium]|jgi:hypothetical protein